VVPWLTTYSLAKAAALDAFWKSLTVRGDDRDAGTLTMATIDAIEAFLSALRSAGWSARRGICGDTMDGFGGARLACDLPSGHASWHGCDNPGGTRCSWTHTDALHPTRRESRVMAKVYTSRVHDRSRLIRPYAYRTSIADPFRLPRLVILRSSCGHVLGIGYAWKKQGYIRWASCRGR
jgi:hypothetical protein